MGTENRKGPLKDVKVLDFTIALAGVYVAWQFADMGAEVWKVERYGSGDQARTWDPFVNGLSTLYTAYNKNKQSIELDLSSQEGKQVIYDMVKEADVVLENFKSGSIDRLGLGYEELKKINRIIDKEYPEAYRETLVVLDGTTGQNALVQARQFMEAADITGIILTKLDGTAKGGIAVAIQSELGIPVKYIGIGEKIDDLQKFDANDFVNALFHVQS